MFFKIPNNLILHDLRNISTKSYYIYTYLLYEAHGKPYAKTSLQDIMSFANIKDTRTCKKYLNSLIKYNHVDTVLPNNKYYLFKININTPNKHYQQVPNHLFTLEHVSWSIYTLLCILYNIEWGYAQISYAGLMKYTGINKRSTISSALNILTDKQLVKSIHPIEYINNQYIKYNTKYII